MMFIVRERLGPREGNGVYIRAQTGFEGSQEARALDEEFAITSTPSSVRLVSILSIDRVDGIEICLALLRGVQIYEPNEVRIKMSRSEDHNRQKPDITRKKIVEACVYDDGKKKKARSKGVNLKVRWRAKFAVRYRC